MIISVCKFSANCPCKVAVYEPGDEDGRIVVHICSGDPLQGIDVNGCDARQGMLIREIEEEDVDENGGIIDE